MHVSDSYHNRSQGASFSDDLFDRVSPRVDHGRMGTEPVPSDLANRIKSGLETINNVD